ncbi:MAG: tRNA (adenosine(37)-N6)-threonylcarbamoyltransferase complex transferase subunit TsaD [Leptonema illini]|uniref:tRNA N6-adenosine threonylcarbamoyltransferase n=1 Tax=Leptonema illini TaxID=183 RepID=A0A833H4A0_9LEPT|nr:MAG: tRNA (adenosine(37)-N6)-threonylcarbamoyltransferase complex transferase subunit TsaD [Leptonema illini]
MIGIGIESSCDETSVAIVEDGNILSNQIYSQIKEHMPYLGVVPEIASRSHLLKINELYDRAIAESGRDIASFDYVAVTTRPGLVGSLMIGAQLARCLHLVHGLPIVTVDHVEAHFYAGFLERRERPSYPFLGLLLSGGNSAVFRVEGPGRLIKLADTRDDALGEAFDKASNVLGLGYPGGPHIERAASQYAPAGKERFFPAILKDLPPDEISFSFSGIKTAVLLAAKRGEQKEKIAYHFQETAFDLVERMLLRALRRENVQHIEASGGVLANQTLRHRLDRFAEKHAISLKYPVSKALCTDNAAMVASLGRYLFEAGIRDPADFPVSSVRMAYAEHANATKL